MGALVVAGAAEVWMIDVLAVVLGFAKVFENPARQTFLREMVGNELITNVVSLNSMEMNLARVIGPTIAGVMVATIGLGACFIANGLSFAVVIAMLLLMRSDELRPGRRLPRAKGQLMEGFRYVRSEPAIRTTLLMMAIIGTFTYEFQVLLPLLGEFTFGRNESGYAALTAAMGVGAVIGGLYTAGKRGNAPSRLVVSAAMFGLAMLLVSAAPTFPFAVLAMVIVGFFSINFTSLGNATLQLTSAPQMQGRVMSLWSIAFLGTTPIGGPIMGALGEHIGARVGIALGGVAALVAAGIGLRVLRAATQRQTRPTDPLTAD
jgi:predicted MFS family arabinose efflux permease